jgi:RNase P/RNase MRP subunit POP5
MTLKRREKRRYISVMHAGKAEDAFALVVRRHAEIFGSLVSARAALRLMKSSDKHMVMRCSLRESKSVLAAIALADPAMVTLDMSSLLRRMVRRHD